MSFRYRLILSFITIEVIFLSLIVFVNFSSLQRASYELTNEKMETSSHLFAELIKTPLSVYDLATIDDAVQTLVQVKKWEVQP